jgi:hypothetical protein
VHSLSAGKCFRKAPSLVFRGAYLLLAWLLFAPLSLAQDDQFGCGPPDEPYRLVKHKERPMPAPPADKALVFVYNLNRRPVSLRFSRSPNRAGTLPVSRLPKQRLGVNGRWVGALETGTYFFFQAEPGLLRVCEELSKTPLFLTVEAGKAYYVQMVPTGELATVAKNEAMKRLPASRYVTLELVH